MKLDNIIYDVDKLGAAIQNDLINESATFKAMYPSQTATELVNVLSGYSTMLQYNMVSALANCYTDTAYSPTGIYQLAETLGNRLHGNISSQLTCTIKRSELEEQLLVTIPAGSIFNVEGLEFFNKEDIIFPRGANDTVSDITLIQGTKNVTERIASGIGGERFYFSEDFSCNTNMVSVTVQDEEWSILDTFLPLNMANLINESQANSFVLRTDPDGRSYLKCGSGADAKIPAAGSSIKITWVSNQGSTGNITKSNVNISLVTPIYYITSAGRRVKLEVEVINSTPATGGFDTQDLMTLKESSPYIFASGDRAVRRNDYKALLLNKCGYKTCNVWGEYEQANMEGTYNKIMMNMVYYSGIKSYQKYELQKLSTLDLDTNSLNFYEVITSSATIVPKNKKKWYYEINGYSNSIRGFLGSYELEISTFDAYNNALSFVYTDKYGTGILTLDYLDNKDLIDLEKDNSNIDPFSKYIIDDLGPDLAGRGNENRIYDYNDPIEAKIYNQNLTDQPITDLFNIPGTSKSSTYYENECYEFSGKVGGKSTLLLPNNPVQILFHFPSRREVRNVLASDIIPTDTDGFNQYKNYVDDGVITGFIFKAPNSVEKLKKFIGSFAIYGTTYNDISIDGEGEAASIVNVKNSNKWEKLTDTITISQTLSPGQWTDWFTLNVFNTDTGKWKNYTHYLIEIYSFRDQTSTDIIAGDRLAIGEIRACYGDQELITTTNNNDDNPIITTLPGRSSYIYYNNNNYTTLRIPYYPTSTDNNLMIPNNFEFYSYTVTVDGCTAANGYVSGQELLYKVPNTNYIFKVRIINNISGECSVSVSTNNGDSYFSVLKGQKYLEITSTTFDNDVNGAKISVISESCVNLYSNYIGNFYTNTDIQKLDLPTIEKYNHFTTYLEFKQPRIKNIYVDISVEYENITTINDVKNNVINAINSLFEITPYYLGKTFSVSDLWKTVSMVEGVKRLIVNAPTDNIAALPYELISLPATNLTIHDISGYDTSEIRLKD